MLLVRRGGVRSGVGRERGRCGDGARSVAGVDGWSATGWRSGSRGALRDVVEAGVSASVVASVLGVHRATVYRMLERAE